MSSRIKPETINSINPIMLKALIAGIVAAVINMLIFFIGRAMVGGIDVDMNGTGQFAAMPFFLPMLASLLPMLAAGLGLWILRRFFPRANQVFAIGTAVVVLLSLAVPFSGQIANTSAAIVLALMHIIVGVLMIGFLGQAEGKISYEATVAVNAPPEALWSVMTDGARYTEWDSGITLIEGKVQPGAKITIASETSPGQKFPVTVTEFDAPKAMTWVGGLPFGLFNGVRYFLVHPDGAGSRFTTGEDFSGPLLKLMNGMVPDLQASFEKLAANLKAEVERSEEKG